MKQFITLLLVLCALAANAQTVLYVDSSVTASGAGISWPSAYKTLNEALNTANGNPTSITFEIRVAQGTYYPTRVRSGTRIDSTFRIIRGGIKVMGGYPSGGGARNPTANPVILSGAIAGPTIADNSWHVMVVANIAATADSIVVDGLTITGGYAHSMGIWQYGGVSVRSDAGGGLATQAVAPGKLFVRNCSLEHNAADGNGGGVCNDASAPTFTGCRFTSNVAFRGGGVANLRIRMAGNGPVFDECSFYGNQCSAGGLENGGGGMFDQSYFSLHPVITRCSFVRNTSAGEGGGVYCINSGGTAGALGRMLSGSTFYNNTSVLRGGGASIVLTGMSYRIDSCIFVGNRCAGQGGGLYSDGGGVVPPLITHCLFALDTADEGGGFYARSNSHVGNSQFSQNYAGNGGGLFMVYGSAYRRFWNNSFSGNFATGRGAGAYGSGCGVLDTLAGCIFSGNKALLGGGGLCDSNSKLRIVNCSFAGDTAPKGNAIYNMDNSAPLVLNSIVWDGAANGIVDSNATDTVRYSDIEGGHPGTGNSSFDPAFINPQPASAAPTALGNYRLKACSAAIDSGTTPVNLYATDIDGNPRITGIRVDLGAYEYQGGPSWPRISGKDTICFPGTSQFLHPYPGGLWSSSNPGVGTTSTTGLFTSASTGTTQITYLDPSGTCTGSATKVLTIVAPPVVGPIQGPDTVCLDSARRLWNATPGGVWTNRHPGTMTIDGLGNIRAVAPGIDTVSYTVTNGGCATTAILEIAIVDCAPLGVTRTGSSGNESLRIIPNPSGGLATLLLTLHGSSEYQVQVYDVAGRLLRMFNGRANSGIEQLRLDGETLSPGIYSVRVDRPGRPTLRTKWIRN